MYGTQAPERNEGTQLRFENDVNMYGTQAITTLKRWFNMFENDVNMYGTQANPLCLVVSRPV